MPPKQLYQAALPRDLKCIRVCENSQHFLVVTKKKKKTPENYGSNSDVSLRSNDFNDLVNDLIWGELVSFAYNRSNDTKCRIQIYNINTNKLQFFKSWLWSKLERTKIYSKSVTWETCAALSSHSQTEEPFYDLFMLVRMAIFHSLLWFGFLHPPLTTNERKPHIQECGN